MGKSYRIPAQTSRFVYVNAVPTAQLVQVHSSENSCWLCVCVCFSVIHESKLYLNSQHP